MKRFLIIALAIGLACTTWSSANAGCHHHRGVQMRVAYYAAAPMYYAAPAPVQTFHQFQTIGGPAPTQVYDSAPVYGQPITEAAPIQVQVQAAPVQTVQVEAAPVQVQAVAVVEAAPAMQAAETIPVEATHPVETIAETPIMTEAVSHVTEVAPAPVQYVEAAPQVQYVESAPAPTFVQTPPANRANIIETYYQPSMMYFQPAPVMMLPAAPARGCRHCRFH